MPVEIAFTQHHGKNLEYPEQQDTLFNGARVFQRPDLKPGHYTADFPVDPGCLVVAVADGVGSSPKAERASHRVLKALATEVAKGAALDQRLVRRLHGQLCDALAKGKTFGSATTLAAAALRADRCTVINVGDSRVYWISANNAWRQLSHDHTLINSMIDRGEADADTQYASFYYSLDSCLVADDEETEFAIHRIEAPWSTGDSLLLCTDGVHDVLKDAGLQRLNNPQRTPLEQVTLWRQAVLKVGAPDNLSMVLARHSE